jgi:hypothetical protein
MEKAGAGNVVQLVGWSVKNGFASRPPCRTSTGSSSLVTAPLYESGRACDKADIMLTFADDFGGNLIVTSHKHLIPNDITLTPA